MYLKTFESYTVPWHQFFFPAGVFRCRSISWFEVKWQVAHVFTNTFSFLSRSISTLPASRKSRKKQLVFIQDNLKDNLKSWQKVVFSVLKKNLISETFLFGVSEWDFWPWTKLTGSYLVFPCNKSRHFVGISYYLKVTACFLCYKSPKCRQKNKVLGLLWCQILKMSEWVNILQQGGLLFLSK